MTIIGNYCCQRWNWNKSLYFAPWRKHEKRNMQSSASCAWRSAAGDAVCGDRAAAAASQTSLLAHPQSCSGRQLGHPGALWCQNRTPNLSFARRPEHGPECRISYRLPAVSDPGATLPLRPSLLAQIPACVFPGFRHQRETVRGNIGPFSEGKIMFYLFSNDWNKCS